MRYLKTHFSFKVLNAVLVSCFMVAATSSCEKILTGDSQKTILSERNTIGNIFSFLPFDISEFNLLQSTKSNGLYDGAGFNDKCTFLNKGNFSGLIIYSTLGGEFSRIEHFKKGLLLKGSLLESGEIKDNYNVMYLAVYPTVQTKSDGTDDGDEYDGGILPPIIVTPTAPPASQPKDNQSMEEEESGGGGPSGSDLYKDDNSGGGGGGSSGGNYNSGQTYTVSVTVSMLSNGFGSVTGSGEYTAGSSAAIVASPVWEYQFYNWSGDFAGKPSSFSFQVEKDVSAEANFRIIDLCIDAINNKSNPLRVMKLAPPKNSLPIAATYGNTRKDDYGNPKLHNGIDLYAPLGTPVYSMFNGTVTRIVNTQPNKKYNGSKSEYPFDYLGDKNPAGNRIYIESSIEGQRIDIGYWHLQGLDEGNGPIAINHRTGEPFKSGDIVYQGEIIGYVGYTGNADRNNPHLHLNLKNNGINDNPANFLNAIISTTSIQISLLNCNE